MPSETLADRARWLIDRYHDGNVNAASGRIGIPQRTLAFIVSGEVKNPRAETLRAIADYHGTTVDWLITGRGEQPVIRIRGAAFEDPVAAAGLLRLDRALDALGLDRERGVGAALGRMSSIWAYVHLGAALVAKKQERTDDGGEAWMRAAGLVADGWAAALETMSETYGAEFVRAGLELQSGLAFQDPDFLLWLRREKKFTGDPRALFEEFKEREIAETLAEIEVIAKEAYAESAPNGGSARAASEPESSRPPAKQRKRRHA